MYLARRGTEIFTREYETTRHGLGFHLCAGIGGSKWKGKEINEYKYEGEGRKCRDGTDLAAAGDQLLEQLHPRIDLLASRLDGIFIRFRMEKK